MLSCATNAGEGDGARSLRRAVIFYIVFYSLIYAMSTTNLKQADFERIFKQNLKIESFSKSIQVLFGLRSLTKIDYKPYYQRNYVWDTNKATYFIESILLGTEIPPLVFFNNGTNIEVIDGRQRFETIKKFLDNEFSLTGQGLTSLRQLKKYNFADLNKKENAIIETFLDAKLRIIQFEVVNEPKLDKHLEDRIKKEIFSRYNSGITPLKKAEIDNAIYDEDPISTYFKKALKKDTTTLNRIYETFFKTHEKFLDNPPLEKVLQFIRKNLVLPKFPINYFARSTDRNITIRKLYEFLSDTTDSIEPLFKAFIKKAEYCNKVLKYAIENGIYINPLMLDCLMWGLSILEVEKIDFDYSDKNNIKEISDFFLENKESFNDRDYHFFKEIFIRYSKTADFFEEKFGMSFNIYLTGSAESREHLKELKKSENAETKLSELEALRLNKPDPSRISIEDIVNSMMKRRFLVRPSYQRSEVVNQTKASLIIESILLGIALPAIFLYKRENGLSEVIDGQQRILTLLSYIGKEYNDENGKTIFSKNHEFNLRKLKILTEYDNLKYKQLPQDYKDKILDFQLYVVEIEEKLNPDFNPVDLFIRLNDKPYPIRENSFEMWNSWVDFELIERLKTTSNKFKTWFFLKQLKEASDRDRMENEELITCLVYLEYNYVIVKKEVLDIYQIRNRINARIKDKASITTFLQDVTMKPELSKDFYFCVRNIESFIKKLHLILLDCDKTKDEVFDYLKIQLDFMVKGGQIRLRRTLQDFYILWYFLHAINIDMVRYHRLEMKKMLLDLFLYIKSIPENEVGENKGYIQFKNKYHQFMIKYQKDQRKIKLSESEKSEMIKEQNNQCSITGAPIFLGDDIEADHTNPLGVGGKDVLANLGIAHTSANREKGTGI